MRLRDKQRIIIAELQAIQQRAIDAELWATYKALNQAINVVEWEVAGKMDGDKSKRKRRAEVRER